MGTCHDPARSPVEDSWHLGMSILAPEKGFCKNGPLEYFFLGISKTSAIPYCSEYACNGTLYNAKYRIDKNICFNIDHQYSLFQFNTMQYLKQFNTY